MCILSIILRSKLMIKQIVLKKSKKELLHRKFNKNK